LAKVDIGKKALSVLAALAIGTGIVSSCTRSKPAPAPTQREPAAADYTPVPTVCFEATPTYTPVPQTQKGAQLMNFMNLFPKPVTGEDMLWISQGDYRVDDCTLGVYQNPEWNYLQDFLKLAQAPGNSLYARVRANGHNVYDGVLRPDWQIGDVSPYNHSDITACLHVEGACGQDITDEACFTKYVKCKEPRQEPVCPTCNPPGREGNNPVPPSRS
jgi:hypothetical protein